MTKKGTRIHHQCQMESLKGVNYEPDLPPNANIWRRLIVRMKRWNTLNMSHPRCREFYRNRYEMYNEQARHMNSNSFIIHPFSSINTKREIYAFIVMTVSIFQMPFSIFVEPYLYWLEILRLFMLINILFNFLTGYCDEQNMKVVLEPSKIAKRYLLSYFIVDIFFMVPRNQLQLIELKYICMLATVESIIFLRINTCQALLKKNLLLWHLSEVASGTITYLFKIFYIIHFLTCSLYFVPQCLAQENKDNIHLILHGKNSTGFNTYVSFLCCSTSHFFGVSIDDRHFNDSVFSQIMYTIILLSGRMYTLYIFATMLVFFGSVNKSGSQYEEFRKQIVDFSISNKLPQNVKNRILHFFQYKFQKNYFDECKIIGVMSDHLKNELKIHNFCHMINSLNWLTVLSYYAAEEILSQMEQEIFLPNDVVLYPGEKIKFIYFIKSGTAVVRDRRGNELMHYVDGHPIGMISFLWSPKQISIFSIVVIEIMETYKLKTELMMEVFRKYPALYTFYQESHQNFSSIWKNYMAENIDKTEVTKILKSGKLLMIPRLRNQYRSK